MFDQVLLYTYELATPRDSHSFDRVRLIIHRKTEEPWPGPENNLLEYETALFLQIKKAIFDESNSNLLL